MHRKPGIVLDRDVDISKMPLQRIVCVNCIGPRRTEYQLNRPNGFMHGVRSREAGLDDLRRGIGNLRTLGRPGASKRVD